MLSAPEFISKGQECLIRFLYPLHSQQKSCPLHPVFQWEGADLLSLIKQLPGARKLSSSFGGLGLCQFERAF